MSSSLLSRVALVLLAAVCFLQPAAAETKVPGWGIAVIVLGSIAIIAAVVLPIACCCGCRRCETWDTVPSTYPRKANYSDYSNLA